MYVTSRVWDAYIFLNAILLLFTISPLQERYIVCHALPEGIPPFLYAHDYYVYSKSIQVAINKV